MTRSLDSQNNNFPTFYIFVLIAGHFFSGAFQTPTQIINVGLSQGLPKMSIYMGYSAGIFTIFGVVLSGVCLSFMLIIRLMLKHKKVTFKKEVFNTLLITLALNFSFGFILVPIIL